MRDGACLPQRPVHLSRYAELCLAALAAHGLGEKVSVGSFWMPSWIDGTLYPDRETPERLETLAERVDFLVRLCGAWDFGVQPDEETVNEIRRKPGWEAVDACRLLRSPVYHLLRRWHGLPPLPYLGRELAYIRDDPSLEHV